jgi:hypothetical protein
VTDPTRKNTDQPIRRPTSEREAISAVKLSEWLTAAVDAWAEAHDMVRSDAIRALVELGLSASASTAGAAPVRGDPLDLEDLTVRQIQQLLDPSLPTEERERRIRRFTEEFSDERIDLPKPKR